VSGSFGSGGLSGSDEARAKDDCSENCFHEGDYTKAVKE
jgi:hypothetical protein